MKFNRGKKLPMCKPGKRVFVVLPDGRKIEIKGKYLKAYYEIVNSGMDPHEALSLGLRLLSQSVVRDESEDIKWQ